ncbi:MAG: hypothetical protein ACFBZ8_12785 [Opitutales bacterium]
MSGLRLNPMSSQPKTRNCFKFAILAGFIALSATHLQAQFVEPSGRNAPGHAWSQWLGFDFAFTPQSPTEAPLPDPSANTNEPLLGDFFPASLSQVANPAAFITSTNSIYAFNEPAAALVVYVEPPIATQGVLFQIQTGAGAQSTPDPNGARLFHRPDASTDWTEVAPTNAVESANSTGSTFIAWEWDLTGQTVADFYITFDYPDIHSPLRDAVIDLMSTYTPEPSLNGFLLEVSTNATFGALYPVGSITVSPEKPTYQNGDTITLQAQQSNPGFGFLGWQGAVQTTDATTQLVISGDTQVNAVFGARNYDAWSFNNFTNWLGTFQNPPAADLNTDGGTLDNWRDYAHGLDPEAADDIEGTPSVSLIEIAGQQHLALSYKRQPLASDLAYTVEVSSADGPWRSNADPGGPHTSAPVVVEQHADGSQTVRVHDLTPTTSASTRFIRLQSAYNES